ncbi:hypothetical protein C1646_762385 [Rhizophagus diaphanus]|nr:hypothetical protein C1646_762385 [Rhizophagus diaphanus] [Rhizophagus sp. MUCL 43196]
MFCPECGSLATGPVSKGTNNLPNTKKRQSLKRQKAKESHGQIRAFCIDKSKEKFADSNYDEKNISIENTSSKRDITIISENICDLTNRDIEEHLSIPKRYIHLEKSIEIIDVEDYRSHENLFRHVRHTSHLIPQSTGLEKLKIYQSRVIYCLIPKLQLCIVEICIDIGSVKKFQNQKLKFINLRFDLINRTWLNKAAVEFTLPDKPFAEGGMCKAYRVYTSNMIDD